MTDAGMPLAALKERVAAFCAERDWDRFHGARDLAIGIVTEAAELLELFRFRSDHEIEEMLADPARRRRVEEETADVLFFVVRLAQRYGIDLATAFEAKLAVNAERYPVDKSRGSNRKYTEL
jgi:NTP pyrophosphatase (non-canonical NTP hydrolase)